MKIGRNFAENAPALVAAGMAERAIYVERGTMAGELRARRCARRPTTRRPISRSILVAGEGPAA